MSWQKCPLVDDLLLEEVRMGGMVLSLFGWSCWMQ